jgi:hypothetical protein
MLILGLLDLDVQSVVVRARRCCAARFLSLFDLEATRELRVHRNRHG